MGIGTYRIKDKKCATCRWWDGGRKIDFVANKPTYIKADSSPGSCLAQSGKSVTASSTCPKYTLWEKLI